jgi:hypothetical protein
VGRFFHVHSPRSQGFLNESRAKMPEINVFRVVQLILASLEGFPYLVLVKNPDQNEVLVLQIYFVKPILFI